MPKARWAYLEVWLEVAVDVDVGARCHSQHRRPRLSTHMTKVKTSAMRGRGRCIVLGAVCIFVYVNTAARQEELRLHNHHRARRKPRCVLLVHV
jgi:hypothetical protein